jgi:hypothetical protein
VRYGGQALDPGPWTLDGEADRERKRSHRAQRHGHSPPRWRAPVSLHLVEPRTNASGQIDRRFGVDHHPRDAIDFIHRSLLTLKALSTEH